jgi:hypothetical protein
LNYAAKGVKFSLTLMIDQSLPERLSCARILDGFLQAHAGVAIAHGSKNESLERVG